MNGQGKTNEHGETNEWGETNGHGETNEWGETNGQGLRDEQVDLFSHCQGYHWGLI